MNALTGEPGSGKSAKALPVNASLLGAAAEHFVMSQLLRRGRLAALAPAGMPFADILVCDSSGGALSAVQVKARTYGADGGWHMKAKHESFSGKLYVYCFIDFGVEYRAQPKCWIIPSVIVATALTLSFQAWLKKPGKGGMPHKDHDMRRLRPDYSDLGLADYGAGWLDPYNDAWDKIAAAESVGSCG